jgi:NAD(P)-dependent dehydrogenase (short-subunit alcohol dehydrogenase family)
MHTGVSADTPLGIVISGASTGLGWAMARKFLAAGDRVLICARNEHRLEAALHGLKKAIPGAEVFAEVCDVSNPSDVERFSGVAVSRLGKVDRWINNAGTAGILGKPFWEIDSHEIDEICRTNLIGSMLMSAQAVRIMIRQDAATRKPRYHIFNMGFSSAGARMSKSPVPHKATKTGVAMVTRSLSSELKRFGVGSIGVHEVSPGLVLTDLLLRGAGSVEKKMFNVLAEEPETVAAFLVPAIRSVQGTGTTIRFRSSLHMLVDLVTGLPLIFRGGRFFDRYGARVEGIGRYYRETGAQKLFDGDD